MNLQRLKALKGVKEHLPLLTAGSYTLSVGCGMLIAALQYYPFGIPFFDFATLQDVLYLGVLNFWNGFISIAILYIVYKIADPLISTEASFKHKLKAIVPIMILLVWWAIILYHPKKIDIEGGYDDVYRVQVKSEFPKSFDCVSLIGSTFDYLFLYNYLDKRTLVVPRNNVELFELLQKGMTPQQNGWSIKQKTVVRQEVRAIWEEERSKLCGIIER